MKDYQFRFENEWPLARTEWRKFYLKIDRKDPVPLQRKILRQVNRCRRLAGAALEIGDRKNLKPFGAQNQTGWLGVYQQTVSPVHEGAVLAKK